MSEQPCQITVISQDEASHAGTIKPRLESSITLITSLLSQLESKRAILEKINDSISIDDPVLDQSLNEEKLVYQTIVSLDKIHKMLAGVCALANIPPTLACAITVVRVLSSSLFELMPMCSQQLCELSVRLGSIVMDSAILTSANCDFGASNTESVLFLDEARLMADSKVDGHHPNLQISDKNNTWHAIS